MTEEDAKTKWCPLVRTTPETKDYHPFTNRGDKIQSEDACSGCKCIGSACMAWRKTYNTSPAREPIEDGGYCGLAGKP